MEQFSICLHLPVTYIHTPKIDIYTQTVQFIDTIWTLQKTITAL